MLNIHLFVLLIHAHAGLLPHDLPFLQLEKENALLKSKFATVEQQLADRNTQLADSSTQLADRNTQLAASNEQLKLTQGQHENLQESNASLHSEIVQVKQAAEAAQQSQGGDTVPRDTRAGVLTVAVLLRSVTWHFEPTSL